jgi:hypothetical protein
MAFAFQCTVDRKEMLKEQVFNFLTEKIVQNW